jgi:hypothetical protein
LSCGFEADSADKGVKIINDALVEAVELSAVLLVEPSIRAYGAEKAGREGRIDALGQYSIRINLQWRIWFHRRPAWPMYLATVDCATVKPSLSNSPWMWGAPQSLFFLEAHAPDQHPQFRRDGWPSSAIAGFTAPVVTEALAMPIFSRSLAPQRSRSRWC